MKEIATEELKRMIDEKERFILLDCRGIDYYNWEHLPHAVNLRWKYVVDKAEKVLKSKDTKIVTSCDGFTCGASIRCYENLRKLGYKNIYEYSGGIADWKAHGYVTVKVERYKIAPNIYRFPDQEFYGEEVGSYLIEEDEFILLIDGPQQLTEEHEDFIRHFDKPIKVFMTHGPTAGDAAVLQKRYKAKIYLHTDDISNEWLTVKPDILIQDGFSFNNHLKVIHTPGHSPGSSVLLDTHNNVLFSGDHLEGTKSDAVADFLRSNDSSVGNKKLRFKSAQKLQTYDFDMLLPFHYEMIRTDAKDAVMRFIKKYENNNR